MNVRNGRGADLRFVLQMMRDESNAVGFVPSSKIAWGLERGRVLVAHAGRLNLGYMLLGAGACGYIPIFQTVTEAGVRRREIGEAMVEAAIVVATTSGAWGLECRCRDDLEANAFWAAVGFERGESVAGGAGRGRRVNLYERRISPSGRG